MNIKRILAVLVALLTLSSASLVRAKTMEFTIGSTSLYISDNAVTETQIETAPYTVNDRTMIPVRIVSENFDCDVKWVEEINQVQIKNEETEILLTLGSNEATVNGEKVTLDVPPTETNGRTMVPLRFISETLSKSVSYIPVTDQVVISDEKPVMNAGGYDFTVEDYRYFLFKDGTSPDEITEENIAEISALLAESAVIAGKAGVEKNITTNQEDFESINKFLDENRDDIYKVSLMAPVARWQTLSAISSQYMDTQSKEEAKKYNPEQIYRTEYACVKRILIGKQKNDAEAIINDCLEKVNSGESFDTLCEKYSEDPAAKLFPEGHVFSKGEMTEEFENVVFSLQEGEMSQVVHNDYGYYIVKRLPLPEMDKFISYTVENKIYQEIMSGIYDSAMKDAEIKMYVSDEEIADLLSK